MIMIIMKPFIKDGEKAQCFIANEPAINVGQHIKKTK